MDPDTLSILYNPTNVQEVDEDEQYTYSAHQCQGG